ncbi:DUF362 domain-containing protein [bacterium]|jgi:uncharacterized protein (DUF362 family)|nr:DUF362 domain-containing protein [bacterium]
MKRRNFLYTTAGLAAGGLIGPRRILRADEPKPLVRMDTPVGQKATVGVARGSSMTDAVRKAVQLSGGMDFLAEGETVLIKPNCTGAFVSPTTTAPEVLYAVIKLAAERGPRRILVSDRCFSPLFSEASPRTIDVMKAVGHLDAVEQARTETKANIIAIGFEEAEREYKELGVEPKTPRWQRMKPEGASHWPRGYELAQLLFSVDHVINVPVIKTHFQAWFTMSMKAFVGMSHHRTRLEFHSEKSGGRGLADQLGVHALEFKNSRRRRGIKKDMHKEEEEIYPFVAKIAELNLGFKPTLNIMDGSKSFVFGGPSHGDEAEPKVIVASRDRVAADVVGVSILKHFGCEERIMNRSVWQIPFVRHACKIGIGVQSNEEIDLAVDDLPYLDEVKKFLAEPVIKSAS